MVLAKVTNNLYIFKSNESLFSSFLIWPSLAVIFFDVFLCYVCIMMNIFFASSHTYFRHDLKRISKYDDRFEVKSWYKIEEGFVFLALSKKKACFSRMFAPEFSVSKKKFSEMFDLTFEEDIC